MKIDINENIFSYLPPVPYWYGCPYNVAEDEHHVNITVESFLQTFLYSIDKSTKKIAYARGTGLYNTGDFIINIIKTNSNQNKNHLRYGAETNRLC